MAAIVPLLYARYLDFAESAMMVLMTMLVTTLKEIHQEGASAAKYGNIGDVIGQYTPVQAFPKDGTEFPYWLIVWPMLAVKGRSPAEGLKDTTWRLGTMGSMGCLCAIGGMARRNVAGRLGTQNVYHGRKCLAIGAVEFLRGVVPLKWQVSNDLCGTVKITWMQGGCYAKSRPRTAISCVSSLGARRPPRVAARGCLPR